VIKVGIDTLAIYTSRYALDLKTLAAARNVDADKYAAGLGQYMMSVPPPGEDVVTMAANAAKQALQGIDLNKVEMLLFATESGIDQSKAAGVYVHELVGLPPRCRVVEFKLQVIAALAEHKEMLIEITNRIRDGHKKKPRVFFEFDGKSELNNVLQNTLIKIHHETGLARTHNMKPRKYRKRKLNQIQKVPQNGIKKPLLIRIPATLFYNNQPTSASTTETASVSETTTTTNSESPPVSSYYRSLSPIPLWGAPLKATAELDEDTQNSFDLDRFFNKDM